MVIALVTPVKYGGSPGRVCLRIVWRPSWCSCGQLYVQVLRRDAYNSTGSCEGDAGHQILQPINANGTSVFNGESTSPAKFRVCDADGLSIGTPGVVSSFYIYKIVGGTVVDGITDTVDSTTPDTVFRWDATEQQWIFNINNKSLTANQTYYFQITLNDGTTILLNYGLK